MEGTRIALPIARTAVARESARQQAPEDHDLPVEPMTVIQPEGSSILVEPCGVTS